MRARVCLATDPDADRLGVAVKTANNEWVTLTGNQIGCILLEHILSTMSEQGKLPENGVVIKSIVSTRLADAICKAYGVELENVMTGFRFIGEKVDQYQTSGGKRRFSSALKKASASSRAGLARDKDAVCAAMFAAEACIAYAQRGMTLSDALDEIYETYGYYQESVKSYTLEGKEGMECIADCMRTLRANPPKAFAETPVAVLEDYLSGERKLIGGTVECLSLPASDTLRWLLTDDSWIVIRPSGTEPQAQALHRRARKNA